MLDVLRHGAGEVVIVDVGKLRALLAQATPGPWRSMRQGNQYLGTVYMPTAKLVGASVIEPIKRPWNPHAAIPFGITALQHEQARFTDGDADLIVEVINALPWLIDAYERSTCECGQPLTGCCGVCDNDE